MLHIEEDVLDQYAMGTLSGELIPQVEEHLLSCGLCQTRLVQTDEFLTLFSAAAIQPEAWPLPHSRRGLFYRSGLWTGAAAVAGLAVVLFISVPQKHGRDMEKPTMVMMESLRGPASQTRVASGRPLLLVFDLPATSPSGPYEFEAVDTAGRMVFHTRTEESNGRVAGLFPKPAPGSYWIRVYRTVPVRELLAEYGLDAQ
jgi:hypothetical protein